MPRSAVAALALAADALLVLAFAATGRAAHDGAVLAGLLQTAWPFLAALAAGWLVTLAWRAPLAPARTGLPVWAITLAGGMLLRAVTGQGTAVSFVLVAAGVLLVTLVGWRLLAAAVRSIRSRRSRAHSAAGR